MQLRGTFNRVGGISVGVLLRCAHVALGVNRVVEFPVGRRRDSYTCAEHAATLRHTHQRIESAVAPAPDTDAVFVYVGQRAEIDGSLNLVFRLEVADVQICTLLELRTASARSASVNAYADEALLSQIRVERTARTHRACAPFVLHHLAARSAVLVHDDRIAL